MKRPAFVLALDLEDMAPPQQQKNDNDFPTSYHCDGVTIGADFLRFEGSTITRGKLHSQCLSMEETIGRGAFNKVQRAVWQQHSTNNREVAIKEYPMSSSPKKREMLVRELRSLCRMDCTCLVQLHGAYLERENVVLVLEYMNQGSLENVLDQRQRPFSPSMVAGAAFQLLTGLEHLHHQRVIHRDVKTENCLMHSDGAVKLCDFGVASLGDQSMHKTMVGTTKFLAPERIRARQYGRSSDLWSLGLVLRHLVTNELPWKRVSSMVDLCVTIEETPTAELIPSRTHKGLQEILSSCLQHVPKKRMPASMLLRSPFFAVVHGIHSVADAKKCVLEKGESTLQTYSVKPES